MTLKISEKKLMYLSKTLWLVLIVLVLLTAGRVYTFAAASKDIPKQIELAKSSGNITDEIKNKNIQKHKDTAQALQKAPLFTPVATPPKPQLPVCTSILGDRAFIGGKFYEVDQEVNGAKILRIGANEVTIMWEEKETKLVPFAVSNLTAEQKKAGPIQPKGQPQDGQPQPQVVVNSEPQRRPPDRGRGGERRGGPGGGMSQEERQKMIEQYQKMSPEEQQRFREEKMREFRNRQR